MAWVVDMLCGWIRSRSLVGNGNGHGRAFTVWRNNAWSEMVITNKDAVGAAGFILAIALFSALAGATIGWYLAWGNAVQNQEIACWRMGYRK